MEKRNDRSRPNSRPLDQRLRAKLRRMRHDDAREIEASSLESITKRERARLVHANPNALPDRIEAMLARILAAGRSCPIAWCRSAVPRRP